LELPNPQSSAAKPDASPPPRRFRAGLQTRFLLTFGVIIVGLMTATVAFVVRSQTQSLLKETRERGFAIARSIAWLSTPSLLSYNYVALGQAAHRSEMDPEILYVVIYDKEGQIAADSRAPNTFGQPPRSPADLAAHLAKEERWSYLSAQRTGGTRMLEALVPVYVEGGPVKWGTVRLAMSLAEVDSQIATTTRQLILEGIIAAILCMIAARLAARGITRPVERLVVATRAIARGDYSQRLNLKSGDEIETLAWHFDRMAEEVQRQQGEALASRLELERVNQSLEAAVEARTHALAESEAKYRVLVESSPLGIAIVQAGHAVFVNSSFERMTGRPASEILEAHADPVESFTPESRERVRDAVAGLGDGGQVPAQILHAAGRHVFVEVQAVPLVFQNEPATMVIVADVSTLRDLQEQLVRGEKLRALGELSAGVAHDFNNILGIILGRAQLLQMRATDPDIISGLEVIRKAAQDGGQTVRRIQQFSRTREDQSTEVLHLPALAEEVVEITRGKWKHESERHGSKIEVRIEAEDAPAITGSRGEIREALTNLIFNSVDAMPEGGTITIAARRAGGDAVLEVRDTGVGMTEEVRSRMFEPFFTTKGVSGNGLGLSMVYGIVSRHKGTVEVESAPLSGTTVRMRFPGVSEAAAPMALEERVLTPYRARILIVDDEVELLEVIRETLAAAGHEVDTASSGSDGIARFRSKPFDAVLTDLGMPDVSGWEVARTVRSEGEPTVVLGLVTGWGAMVSQELITAHGVDFVIGKPFQVDVLLSKVNQVLAARAAEISRDASPSGPRPT
jgi:PAS domain S-box-containing protein